MTKSNDQLTNGSIIYAMNVDGGVSIIVQLEDGSARTMKINTQAYNVDEKAWYDDDAVLAKAEETVAKIGADINDMSTFAGKTVEVYVSNDRVSFTPIKEYVRYEKLTAAVARKLAKAGELITTPITEFDGLRFNIGVQFPTGEVDASGEPVMVNYRLSTLVIPSEEDEVPDRTFSVKYTTKTIEDLKKNIEDGSVPEGIVEQLKASVESLTEQSRANKIEELKEPLGGKNIEDMIESGETFPIEVEAVTGDFNYLKGVIVK